MTSQWVVTVWEAAAQDKVFRYTMVSGYDRREMVIRLKTARGCWGVQFRSQPGVVRGWSALALYSEWGVPWDRSSLSVCLILTMWGADGVSFVESLPRLFVVGKTGLVLVAVQGAPLFY